MKVLCIFKMMASYISMKINTHPEDKTIIKNMFTIICDIMLKNTVIVTEITKSTLPISPERRFMIFPVGFLLKNDESEACKILKIMSLFIFADTLRQLNAASVPLITVNATERHSIITICFMKRLGSNFSVSEPPL